MDEQKLLETITNAGLNEKEIQKLLKAIKSPDVTENTGKEHPIKLSNTHTKFGFISDTHFGHKCYQPRIMDSAARYFKKEGVDFVIHGGDILEGHSGREGQIYELEKIGASEQLKYGIEELQKLKGIPLYFITASQSHDGWFSSKGNMGFEVGPEIEKLVKNSHFLGYDEADLNINDRLKIKVVHPGGGTAYAISYGPQKIANSLSGGQKPNIMLIGHWHKMMYMMYRNIHIYQLGTLEAQTIFMKKMGTPAMLGYGVLDVYYNRKGVDRIKQEIIPFYE